MSIDHLSPRALAALALAACAGSLHAQLPAFPGAEGFGAYATGGRGGDVYHVTTLADDPTHTIPGSLFYGLYDKNVPAAGRTIVFDVGGVINLGSTTLDIKNIKNVTIAGHTAPSPITIVGNTVQVTSSGGKETSNIILQHVAIRKGLANSGDSLSIKGSGNTHNILVDHVSASWSEDEVISVGGATNAATNVTVQYSTMSEALTSGHQYGSLIRSRQNSSVSYLHNLYSHNASRNPRPGSYLSTTLEFEFQNNVIYNWSDRAGYAGGSSEGNTEFVNMNFVGNYLIAGPSTPAAKRSVAFTRDASNSPISLITWQSGNKVDAAAGPTRDGVDLGWGAFVDWSGSVTSAYPDFAKAAAPFNHPSYANADSADIAYARVMAAVGATPHMRSPIDQRLVNDVLNYAGSAPLATYNAAEWNTLLATPMTTRPANWDTDRDGMPNHWETLRGFNANAADNNTLTPSGYTRLEKYLHHLSAIANWNLNANGNWSDHLNWRGHRPTTEDASANFIPGITAPRTVTLDLPVTLTDLSFSSPTSYTLAGPNTLTLSTFAGWTSVSVTAGSHQIAAPLLLSSPAEFDVASTLTLTNVQPSPSGIVKLGAGSLATGALNIPSLRLSAGALQLLPDSAPSTIPSLTISSGATLDLTNTSLTTTSTPATIREHLADSRLTSSTPDPDDTLSLGYLAAGPTVLIQLTRTGDANLDGLITPDDYALVDKGLATGAAVWWLGDFNYDGTVDQQDYLLIDRSLALQSGSLSPALLSTRESQFGPDYVSELLTSIPEPSLTACLFATSLLLPLSRRKRRSYFTRNPSSRNSIDSSTEK